MNKELNFLVVLDDSEEMFKALKYAALRSVRTNGRVAILYTFDTLDFSHWKAVEDIAEAESRDEAESKIEKYENFEKFLSIVSVNTGISVNEISYISPLWTYKLLTFLSVLMIFGELFAFLN